MELSFQQAIAVGRDVAFIAGVLISGFKVRSWIQPVITFFDDIKKHIQRSEQHMNLMEDNMSVLLNNHLKHLEEEIRKISDRNALE